MANKIPLVVNTGSAQIQELASGDNLSLVNNDIVGVGSITAANNIVSTGNIYGTYFIGNGSQLTGLATGNSTAIESGTSNVAVVSSGGNVTVGIAGTSNVIVVGTSTVTVKANILPAANLTYSLGSPTAQFNDLYLSNSTIFLGNATISANSTAVIMTNESGQQTVISGSGTITSYGNANVASYLASGTDTSNIITTGNVQGTYILGNGSQLTGLPATYGNANVAANLAAFGSNPILTTGNVTAGYVFGNGSQLTGLPATYGNSNVAAYLPTYTGNLGGGNVGVSGAVTAATVSTSGNITGSYILGNGSQLTGLPATYSNANVQAYLPTYSGNIGALLANGNIQVVNGIFIGNGA